MSQNVSDQMFPTVTEGLDSDRHGWTPPFQDKDVSAYGLCNETGRYDLMRGMNLRMSGHWFPCE